MAKPMKPGVLYDYKGNGTFKPAKPEKVAFIDAEAPYSDDPTPGHPDWNITKKGGKKKKKKIA